ncbi:unnamed protein product [Rotaria socialis]|uniref:Retrotransposon gag domain-containing protein n=1 Tax=Rotaria socialis TaxID=392032 RepID=A0A818GIN2_9BILA|nr:unnamed protein product [Rotaria socialis]
MLSNNIERIGKMIDANDNILYCICAAKLDGEAKRWYEDNISFIQWKQLKSSLFERFTTSDSSSKIFEQLKEHKQKLDETVTSYYDAIIKLSTAPYVSYFANTVSTTNYASSTLLIPIYINVQVNNKQHQAIVDTGSAVTLINQQLLKKIYHTELVYKKKLHKSANCTSIDIISEIQLEVKIQGHKTLIIADVAMNLITHLLLGNDWIMQNNVIIDSLQRHLALIDNISTNTF